MLMFGFKSVIADMYYGEVNLRWIKNNPRLVLAYRLFCCALVTICGLIPVTTLWELIDFASALLIIFNVPALLLLSKYVLFALRDFAAQKDKGIENPRWDYQTDIVARYAGEAGQS